MLEYIKDIFEDDLIFLRSRQQKNKDNLSFISSKKVEPVFFKGTNSIIEIFKMRSQKADLKYCSPHTFRHLTVELAFKDCNNGAQMKVISQSFGHVLVATTFSAYANYDNIRLNEVLKSIYFSKDQQITNNEILEYLKNLVGQNIP